ncbi:MAG: hypothetical protein GY940_38460, partial [bacterium]|nr:hypothetical protein [bacterium]
ARNLEEFWQNLSGGKDCIVEVPKDRWDWREYYSEGRGRPGYHYSKWGGFITDVDKFDPLFFNISPRGAEFMDPQERLFLEHAWMAMEDAGYRREDLQGKAGEYLAGQVGVYAGVMYGDYRLFGAEESLRGNPSVTSGSYAGIANRVSYVLNLHGPSMTVDTMCSSSLTTLHLACQDLKHGRTDLGFAGGVNVTIHPNKYLFLSAGQFISSRGHCESFGESGDGYIPGEGVGVALLKRLPDAERDGDFIYGVIKGSAVNHGGKTNGYTVPNPNAQKTAISRALKESGIDPGAINYIEAHGTGTKLGDPIEIAGLSKAFGPDREKQYCWIGSAKSNIGHCESAAGIAGVTKVLLQMRHGKIAPSLHSKVLNPNINFAGTPFVVNQQLRDWQNPVFKGKEYPRTAGISSFGAGGSNAHVLIREYSPGNKKAQGIVVPSASPVMIVLSARNRERLNEYAERLLEFIQKGKKTGSRRASLELQEVLEEKIRALLAKLLRVEEEEIEPGEPFQDYGVEALQQNRLLEQIRETFNLEIHAKEFLRQDSLALICSHLWDTYPGIRDQMAQGVKPSTGATNKTIRSEIDPGARPGIAKMGKPGADQVEKGHEQYTRERGGLPPCPFPDSPLADLAYTLQVGREAMEERLGLIVHSMKDLEKKLRDFIESNEDVEDLYLGRVKRNQEALAVFTADEDLQKAMDAWISKGKYSKRS